MESRSRAHLLLVDLERGRRLRWGGKLRPERGHRFESSTSFGAALAEALPQDFSRKKVRATPLAADRGRHQDAPSIHHHK